MTRDEILDRIREVLVDALAVDEEEVTPDASLSADLGAESIDYLDISFKLEQEFEFKIEQGELFPDNVMQDDKYVQDGKVTDEGIATLKERLPHVDFSVFEQDPQVAKVAEVFKVDHLVEFVQNKLAAA